MDEDLRKAIESLAAETLRHFDTVAARLESKLETVAEGVVSTNERLDGFQVKTHEEFDDVRSMILQTRGERLASATH